MIALKKGEAGRSSGGAEVNIGLQRTSQPTKVSAKRAGPNKGTSEVTISDRPFSGGGAKLCLCYLKEGLKSEKAPKEAQRRPKRSFVEAQKVTSSENRKRFLRNLNRSP